MTHGFQIPGDLALSPDGRNLVIWSGSDELCERILRTLRQWRGQWRYDPDFGPDWWTLLGEPIPREILVSEITKTIRQVAGVESVPKVEIAIDSATRKAHIIYTAQATSGLVQGHVVL